MTDYAQAVSDIRYFEGPYAQQIGAQLWAEINSELGCAHWWARPLCPAYPPHSKKTSTKIAVQCGRCCGAGAIASFSIKYSGKCFACNGSRVRYISAAAWRKQKALRAATNAGVPETREPQA